LAREFGFEVVDGGGVGFDFGDERVLFGEWREGDLQIWNVPASQAWNRSASC